MESNDTNKSDQNITKHLVTYKLIPDGQTVDFTVDTKSYTQLVEGDVVEWFTKMNSGANTRCIIEFAIYLW